MESFITSGPEPVLLTIQCRDVDEGSGYAVSKL